MIARTGYIHYPDSLFEVGDLTYFLARSEREGTKYLGVKGDAAGFQNGFRVDPNTFLFPLLPENAALLRQRFPWLRPQPLGLQLTTGFGDRLGLATPGHVRALRKNQALGGKIAPIFAQQSVRENARTHRTPQMVIDDAMWGVFQSGWQEPWGADADHLKTTADLDAFLDAGYTFFTIDPGDYVDHSAESDSPAALRDKARALPWDILNSSWNDLLDRYLGQTTQIEGFTLAFDETTLLRAAAKYGRAVAHTVQMAKHLEARSENFVYDLEVSVDETETPTSAEEHFFIANELQRLGVQCVSLAPRFVGRFEKGVDYIGDLRQFEAEFICHAAIARRFGYRLSLHSGSDKFSIYGIAARHTESLLHLKTAGTSYLEALRVIAHANPGLFREILVLSLDRYETDRTTYHVSAEIDRLGEPDRIADTSLDTLLDQFDARQILHVTFGAGLDRFGPLLMDALRSHEDDYYDALSAHFVKHLQPMNT